jgi:hypothetical protein
MWYFIVQVFLASAREGRFDLPANTME